jgi:uncharacterized membrane protein YdjX (TVP38/TMEM64 family)
VKQSGVRVGAAVSACHRGTRVAHDAHLHLPPRNLVWLTLAVLAVGGVAASDPAHAGVHAVVVWAQGLIGQAPVAGMVVFVILTALSAMFAFLSSSVLAPVAIVTWGKGGTFLLLWLGWLLGGTLTYAVGRYLGRSVAGRLAGAGPVAGAEAYVRDRTHLLHVLLFQMAMPSEILGYVLGILRYRFVNYVAVLAITEIPYALAVVYLGSSFLEGRSVTFVLIGLTTVGVSVGLYALLRRTVGRPRGGAQGHGGPSVG